MAKTCKRQSAAPWAALIALSACGAAGPRSTGVEITAVIPDAFRLGGTASGVRGTTTLVDENAGTVTLQADGPFWFPTTLPSGAPFAVKIEAIPSGTFCSIAGGTGTMGRADDGSVSVNCGLAAAP